MTTITFPTLAHEGSAVEYENERGERFAATLALHCYCTEHWPTPHVEIDAVVLVTATGARVRVAPDKVRVL